MIMNMNYYAILHEVRSFAGNSDIGVQFVKPERGKNFVPHAKLDRTGKRTIVLEQPMPDWPMSRMIKWRGHFFHEMGHFHPDHADDYEILRTHNIDCSSFFASGLNCLVDYRQEKNELGLYTGRDTMLSQTHSIGVNEIITTAGAKFATLDGNDNPSVFAALLWLSVEARQDWQPDVIGLNTALRSKFSAAVNDKVDLLQSGGFPAKLDACKSAQELYELWCEILKLFERNPDEEEQKGQSKAGKGEGGEAEGESSGSASDDILGDESDSREGAGEPSRRGKEAKINWRDLTTNVHDLPESESFSRVDIDYDGYDERMSFNVASKLDIRDYVNNTGKLVDSPSAEYIHSTADGASHTGLANKIRKLLQVKTQSLTVHGQKHGKLASKNMYRVGVSGLGKSRERVFKKKTNQYDLDTAVSILVDFSGSMGGSRMKHAIISGIMLNEAIGKIRVPVEILGFTDNGGCSTINVLKTFNKPITNERLRENMCKAARNMSNNADGEAILYAHSRLAKQTNKRKLLVVLSDGQPATNRRGCMQFTKDVVKQIESSKNVEIYGLGIESSAVAEIYKHHSVINSPNELEGAVLSVIKGHILK